ncbi:Cys-tRNA(Pro)/Cys-tRNA(Cys) deacylase [Methylomarinovum caldicuralii]|uniref:Cys-tRNA(Pro)/Cys-tRNA(Cys) deacylase n=1 Tax=Methylomarinovum caldicuralii TaxID=438856 RepID=A0AAU9CTP8_9GAMM|nr:YbaK/EbsC family protein [Methylomarinovum caldicuralii]BCX81292.1 Cys-tRNA(Pro)/Cys-tRNA(Cys) deacylase [Methylomarinovum caldicuralii]
MSEVSSPVSELLEREGIAYEWVEIPLDPERKPIRSLEELVEARGLSPAQIVRSLVFRTGSGGFLLLAAPATARADWGKLRKHTGERRLTMAESEQVLAATGYPVGAVPPVALPEDLRVLVDEGIFAHERVFIGAGVLGWSLSLRSADLRRLLARAELGAFTKAA